MGVPIPYRHGASPQLLGFAQYLSMVRKAPVGAGLQVCEQPYPQHSPQATGVSIFENYFSTVVLLCIDRSPAHAQSMVDALQTVAT